MGCVPCYFNWRGFLTDLRTALLPAGSEHMRITGRRARVLVVFCMCMVGMVAFGRLCLFADSLFYRWYRRARVERPVFIVGNFRSGSTLLHRLLAAAPGMTAMKTWQIYFAPSITQRRLWRGIWTVDSLLGSPVRRRIEAAQDRTFTAVEMHRVRLEEPEEDEALLLYLWESLFNWFFMPHDAAANPYWRFDLTLPRWRRRAIMGFYREVIRRHMALSPPGTCYVAKNPAFTAKLESLLEAFPDARIIELVRHPYDTLVSTASWLAYAWHYFASPVDRFPFLATVTEMTRYWYLASTKLSQSLPSDQYALLRYEDLIERPTVAVPRVLEQLGITVSEELRAELQAVERSPRVERSHESVLGDTGLSPEETASLFRDVFGRFGYTP